MRQYVKRKRGVLAVVCLVAVVALAMAPIASTAFCAVLVPVPALFAGMAAGPVLESGSEPLPSVPNPSPLAPRAPPLA